LLVEKLTSNSPLVFPAPSTKIYLLSLSWIRILGGLEKVSLDVTLTQVAAINV
jgi:hypothetical protein